MIRTLPLFGLLALYSVYAPGATAAEQPLVTLTQEEPAFYVRADVDRDDRYYRDGDPIRVDIVCESEAYIYVLYQPAKGELLQIFPNSVQSNNKVPAKEVVSIPAKDDRFRWTISAPYGKEVVTVIASKTPIDPLARKELLKGRFNAVSTRQVKEVVNSLKQAETKTWTESSVEIVTAARDSQLPAKQGRRFGVFFGASEYEFNDVVYKFTEGKFKPNLPCSANNATVMARIMNSVGKLDDFKLCTNQQATKANLQQAICEWLPQVSRPGDTVFVMYCGHGGQIPDDNGDEADGKDEYLLTHDYVDMNVLNPLNAMAVDGTLPDALKPRFASWMEIHRKAGAQRANEMLLRQTCVSDDLLGHWLQKLSGRQILLMLDTCHAGGFATNEKNLQGGIAKFDFLDGEINRLKDLGQADSALIAACGAQSYSYGRRPRNEVMEALKKESKVIGEDRTWEDLAILSYYLVDGIVTLPPPLSAAQLQEHCRVGMHDFFVEFNDIAKKKNETGLTEHKPVYIHYGQRPILLKP